MINPEHIVFTENEPDDLGRITLKASLSLYATAELQAGRPDYEFAKERLKDQLCNCINQFVYEDSQRAARELFLALRPSLMLSNFQSAQELYDNLRTTMALPQPKQFADPSRVGESHPFLT